MLHPGQCACKAGRHDGSSSNRKRRPSRAFRRCASKPYAKEAARLDASPRENESKDEKSKATRIHALPGVDLAHSFPFFDTGETEIPTPSPHLKKSTALLLLLCQSIHPATAPLSLPSPRQRGGDGVEQRVQLRLLRREGQLAAAAAPASALGKGRRQEEDAAPAAARHVRGRCRRLLLPLLPLVLMVWVAVEGGDGLLGERPGVLCCRRHGMSA